MAWRVRARDSGVWQSSPLYPTGAENILKVTKQPFCANSRVTPSACIDVVRGEGVHPDGPWVATIVFDLALKHVFGLADAQAGFVVAPHRYMDFISDIGRNALDAVGGDGTQGHHIKAYPAQLRHQRGFGAGQDHEGDAALFLRFHEGAPGAGIVIFQGVLLFAFVVVAPFAVGYCSGWSCHRWIRAGKNSAARFPSVRGHADRRSDR